jgi:hypothetical protein
MQLLGTQPGETPTALIGFSTPEWEDVERLVDAGLLARGSNHATNPYQAVTTVTTDSGVEAVLASSGADRTPEQITVEWNRHQIQAIGTTMLYGLLPRGISGEHFAPYNELRAIEQKLMVKEGLGELTTLRV